MMGPDQVREEQRRALRALLLRPLLTSGEDTAESLQLVRRHAEHLRHWLSRNVDWTLTVDADIARLRKLPGNPDDCTRPAIDATTSLPFTRRRYVLFCLALAALERSERQTTLGKVAEEVTRLFHSEPAFEAMGLPWDRSSPAGRRDLVLAVRLLLDLGVLSRVQGDESQFLHGQGDVLYSVRRSALALVLAGRRPPSMYDERQQEPNPSSRLRHLIEEPAPQSEDVRNRRLRLALTRRLLDDPVLYYDDLTEEERAYLTSQRAHLCRQIAEATGLAAEVRAEGIALVDEGGRLTDVGLPEEGTEGHLGLLVAEFLAARARRQRGAVVARATVVAEVASLIREHGSHWRKDVRESGAEESLTDQTLQRLHSLSLVRLSPEGVVPLPALGRYALAKQKPTAPASLFPGLGPSSTTPSTRSRRR